jgi:hypothetical protein
LPQFEKIYQIVVKHPSRLDIILFDEKQIERNKAQNRSQEKKW